MFGFKLVKKKEYEQLINDNKLLLLREGVIIARVKNSKLSTFEELNELRNIIVAEYNDVNRRLNMIRSTYEKLKK